MTSRQPLAADDHPAIRTRARALTDGALARRERLERLFHFVRDGVPFGFPPKWDDVRASETLDYGIGYCTTKATLFLALCKAAGIPARVHAGLISLEIMRGVFPAFAFRFLPEAGGHVWLEVEIDDACRPVDPYINDRRFYQGAWDDVADYLASPLYRRMRPAERAAYPLLARMANRAIERIRRSAAADAPPPAA